MLLECSCVQQLFFIIQTLNQLLNTGTGGTESAAESVLTMPLF